MSSTFGVVRQSCENALMRLLGLSCSKHREPCYKGSISSWGGTGPGQRPAPPFAYLPLRPNCSQNALTSSGLFRSYEEIDRELSEFGVVGGSDVFDVAIGLDIVSECADAPVANPPNRTNASNAVLIDLISCHLFNLLQYG